MGKDVIGRNPDAKVGEYFRAEDTLWMTLHAAMCETCFDLIDGQMLLWMAVHSHAGVDDRSTCSRMAGRLEALLAKHPWGVRQEWPGSVLKHRRFVRPLAPPSGEAGKTQELGFYAGPEDLAAWVGFLRHCGGFVVI